MSLNILIYCKIQKTFKVIGSQISDLDSDRMLDLMKKERKVAMMMGADSVLYLVFPLPYAVLYFIDPFHSITAYRISRSLFTVWGSTAIIEPILLLIFKAQYREEIKKMFRLADLSVINFVIITWEK